MVAATAGVSKRTVSGWLRNGLVVRRQLAAVPEAPEPAAGPGDQDGIERALVGAVLRAAQGGDWHAASWLLERSWPQKYGRRRR